VNDEIASTITSSENQSRLAALNNGITIVAREIRIVGKKFTLSDYQIVNGCQTSHIVFEHQHLIKKDTSLPVKIIEAEDRELVNEIVRATNRQTEVKDEAFAVLGDFHKKIERFFLSVEAEPEYKLVYERRKRQYADTAYTAQNIVTLTFLTNAFVSCCLSNPVDPNDYYGVLLTKYKKLMYIEQHSLWPYLLSAMTLREVEKLCIGKARPVLWKFRFIIAALIWDRFGRLPDLRNERAQKNYADWVIRICRDKDAFFKLVRDAEKTLADAIIAEGADFDSRNAHQDRRFVEKLLRAARPPMH
jgi:hypothetical protein